MGLPPREAEALRHALAGVQYPAEKWQLIDHCGPGADGTNGTEPVDPGTLRWLWAVPDARYTGLRQVLRAAARAVHGRRAGQPRSGPSPGDHGPTAPPYR